MTTQQQLDERYGRPAERRTRRIVVVVAALLAAAVAVSVAWTTVTGAAAAVDPTGTGFEVIDERSVVVSFQIDGNADKPVACAMEALDVEHGVVGHRIVEYPAGEGPSRAYTETIPTVAEATTGLVTSCWIP